MFKKAIPLAIAVAVAACSGDLVSNEIARGRQLFTEHCASCHALDAGLVIVGPSLNGVASRAADSGDARAYLERAIKSPAVEIVEGFQDLMPPDFEAKLAPADFDALSAFLLTLE
jgi:cytochrome c2